jgi:hypothetical protein
MWKLGLVLRSSSQKEHIHKASDSHKE